MMYSSGTIVLVLATLTAHAATFSVYPYDCGCATSISQPCAAPACSPCAPAPAFSCVPAPAPTVSCSNLNAIVALLATLKNAGLVPPVAPAPGGGGGILNTLVGLLSSPAVASNPLITANLLNLISIVVGGGPAPAPTNGTLPGVPGTGSLLNLDVLTGGSNGGGLVGGLLGGILGGGPGANGATPAALNTFLLQLLANLATPAPVATCPTGTLPVLPTIACGC